MSLSEREAQAVDGAALIRATNYERLRNALPAETRVAAEARRAPVVVRPGESIQETIEAAPEGSVFYVQAGTYTEMLEVNRPGIRIVGLPGPRGERPVLDGSGREAPGVSVVPGADGFVLIGLTVQNARDGVLVQGVDGFVLYDVTAESNQRTGFFVLGARNGLLSDCRASGSFEGGVLVISSENVLVQRSLATQNVLGFEIENSRGVLLRESRSVGNATGVLALVVPGLEALISGATSKETSRVVIARNVVEDNNLDNFAPMGSLSATIPSGLGLVVAGIDDALILHNRVRDNAAQGLVVVRGDLLIDLGLLPGTEDPAVEPVLEAVAIVGNDVLENGGHPVPLPPGAPSFPSVDLLWDDSGEGVCFSGNTTGSSVPDVLPSCAVGTSLSR